MKRFSLVLVLHILLIVFFAAGTYWLLEHKLWFTSIAAVILLVLTGCNLYRLQLKQTAMVRCLIESLHCGDMEQRIPSPFRNKQMEELADELSGALSGFRAQLIDEEVKHQYYKNLLEKVDTAVIVADRNGIVEWANQAAGSLFGTLSVLPEELLEAAEKKTEIVNFRYNGQKLEMAASATLFIGSGRERLILSLKNIHMVLERNEMEAWQKLIRVLTHEIMNSITPIISLSETLSERCVPDQTGEKEYVLMLQAMQTIHRRSKGLLGFVENYRKLTRIPVPVKAAFSAFVLFSDMKKLFPQPFIHFDVLSEDIALFADRSQIEQVLINLINNAVDACQHLPSPSVCIMFKGTGKKNRIEISDNGDGIMPDVLDKIFVPFFTTKPSGSGIGLSLCRQIMTLHGGNISVCSEKDKGSRFTLWF